MASEKSLIFAYLLDEKGGGKKISWKEIEQWSPDQGVLWVHLNYKANRTEQWLTQNSGLDNITAKAMLIDESRPRSVFTKDGILVFLRGVNLNPGQESEDMVSIRVWISKHCIITTRKRRLHSIDDVKEAIDHGVGPKTPAEFLRILNDRLLDRMSHTIGCIEDCVDKVEQEAMTAATHLLRPKIAETRRQIILIRRYLAPQREVLNRLSFENSNLISKTDNLHFREASDRIIRCIENLDSARERAAVAQEQLSSRLAEQMDRRMYMLSIVAVIFLPLSFITGLLGINVGGIPGANYKWSFLFVSSGLLVLFMIMLWLFYRKKWIYRESVLLSSQKTKK